jgi:RND family efflux transporter MFP subunit
LFARAKPPGGDEHHNDMRDLARRQNGSWKRWAAALTAVAGIALAACTRTPDAVSAPKPPAVTVATVAQRTVPVFGQYVGQTEAVKTVEVRARVEGYLERQAVADGADVKAGDVLFVIDSRPFEATLRQAHANVARDLAQLRQAEATLVQREADVQQAQANLQRDLAQLENARSQERRYSTLLQKELIAREQYDQFRTNMVMLEATVEADRAAFDNAKAALGAARAAIDNASAVIRADEAAVESTELQLGYTTIRSPLDGRMGRAEVRVGSLVGRSDSTLLATVSTLDPVYVNFSVSEREALGIWRRRAGASGIRITLPDDSIYPEAGRLDFVDRAVDPRTGTLALRATFPNPGRLLQPGQYTRIRVLLEERAGALLVPQAAVLESQGSASVFVVGADQTVQARTVTLGPRFEAEWVVEEGVKPGEQVIVSGLQHVRAGMRVEATRATSPRPAGS